MFILTGAARRTILRYIETFYYTDTIHSSQYITLPYVELPSRATCFISKQTLSESSYDPSYKEFYRVECWLIYNMVFIRNLCRTARVKLNVRYYSTPVSKPPKILITGELEFNFFATIPS